MSVAEVHLALWQVPCRIGQALQDEWSGDECDSLMRMSSVEVKVT
jgi:hypothetical protein